jgi:hypothetical protein
MLLLQPVERLWKISLFLDPASACLHGAHESGAPAAVAAIPAQCGWVVRSAASFFPAFYMMDIQYGILAAFALPSSSKCLAFP